MTNITSTKLTKLEIDKILSKNRTQLRAGKALTRAELITMFEVKDVSKDSSRKATFAALQKENLKLVALQSNINALMSRSGLYLKSKDYYSTFEVKNKKETKGEIVRHAGKIDIADVLEITLDKGMVTRLSAGTWGTYNRVYDNQGQEKVSRAGTSTGSRAQIAQNRVKKY